VSIEIPASILDKLDGKLGYSDAIDRVGTTAAPLLAGFALTLIGLTVASDSTVRWPEPTLALLVLAALLLIGAVQSAFNARSWYIPLAEFLTRLEATPENKRTVITGTYAQGLTKHAFWLKATRYTYNFGIIFLLAGLVFVVLPRGKVTDARYGVTVLAAVGFVAEVLWFVGSMWATGIAPDVPFVASDSERPAG
jgi:hypothetical protein